MECCPGYTFPKKPLDEAVQGGSQVLCRYLDLCEDKPRVLFIAAGYQTALSWCICKQAPRSCPSALVSQGTLFSPWSTLCSCTCIIELRCAQVQKQAEFHRDPGTLVRKYTLAMTLSEHSARHDNNVLYSAYIYLAWIKAQCSFEKGIN